MIVSTYPCLVVHVPQFVVVHLLVAHTRSHSSQNWLKGLREAPRRSVLTLNNDLPLPFSSFMPRWFEEVSVCLLLGRVRRGSVGLSCPLHDFRPLLAGLVWFRVVLGCGPDLVPWTLSYFCLSFGPSVGVPLVRPPLRPTSSARLLAYLHERTHPPNHCD